MSKSVQKGYFKNTSSGEIFKFMYNPSEIESSRDVDYTKIMGCGSSYPKFQYLGGDSESISFDLFLHGNASEIKSAIRFLEGLMPDTNPTSRFKVPPTVIFSFGNSFTKECIFIGLRKKHKSFNEALDTMHLEIAVSLEVV